jgi:hypothetical protein
MTAGLAGLQQLPAAGIECSTAYHLPPLKKIPLAFDIVAASAIPPCGVKASVLPPGSWPCQLEYARGPATSVVPGKGRPAVT